MWKFFLANKDGRPVNFEPSKIDGETKYAISTVTNPQTFGVFKSVSLTTASTTTITTPVNGGSIVLTDLVISAEKKNAGTVIIRFTDGTNTINIFQGTLTDAPINLSVPFVGKWEGWRDARLEVVTNQNTVATIALGYYKVKTGRNFTDWDSLR